MESLNIKPDKYKIKFHFTYLDDNGGEEKLDQAISMRLLEIPKDKNKLCIEFINEEGTYRKFKECQRDITKQLQ